VTFHSFLPSDQSLRKWVAYYYTDGSERPDYLNSYLFYPHVYTTLSFYKDATFRTETDGIAILYDPGSQYLKLVTQQTETRRATQLGKTNKIAIAFKPLGLNRFIRENYAALVPDQAQVFGPENDAEWNGLLEELFAASSVDEKTKILDRLLLRQFNGYENAAVERAIEIVSDVNCGLSIDEIAESMCVSRKTLLRYFKSELRMTPQLFRSIVRFRFAVNFKVIHNYSESLTRIAHESNFWDQAYFIKCFKRFTGLTPRQFFRQGKRIGEEDTFWIFNPQKVLRPSQKYNS
jgi:AraC-like DNA-binding protein